MTNMNDMKNKTQQTINNIETQAQSSINNLKVNNNKIYECAKADTKLVLNTAAHCFVIVAICEFAIATQSLAVLLAGGFVIVKTILHNKKTNDAIVKEKKRVK